MQHHAPFAVLSFLLVAACDHGFADPSREYASAETLPVSLNAVSIVVPKTVGVADTHLLDVNGTAIGVACATCHGPEAAGAPIVSGAGNPEQFHAGVELVHGQQPCANCHTEDRLALHLADGTRVEFGDSMRLCGQCHGPQYRDYLHGAHGGMNGFWDLKRGGRTRNHCAACHAPHTPAYEKVMPVFPPRDRYLEVEGEE